MPEIELGYSEPSEKKEEPKSEKSGRKNYRCEVRQISNGWIINESYEENGKYKSKEEYRKEKPIT